MPSLLENRLLMSYLSGAGQDILSGNPIGTNVNAITQKTIAAKSYADLLQQLLSGGGKVTMDSQNVNIKAPTNAFKTETVGSTPGSLDPTKQARAGSLVGQGASAPTAATNAVGTRKQNELGLLSLLLGSGTSNPSSSPLDISTADLAGLTPDDLTQAVRLKLAGQELEARTANDLVNAMYKGSLIKQNQESTDLARIKEMRQWEQMLQTSPLEVPGLGRLTEDQWSKLDAKTKAYSYYAFDANRRGEEVMSYNDFATQSDPSSFVEYYELAKRDPEFRNFFFAAKQAGATRISIGEQVEKAEAMADVKARKYFTDPKGLSADVESYTNSKAFRLKMLEADPDNEARVSMGLKRDFIKGKVEAAGGQFIGVRQNGRTVIWKVRWPDNTTSEVSYAF